MGVSRQVRLTAYVDPSDGERLRQAYVDTYPEHRDSYSRWLSRLVLSGMEHGGCRLPGHIQHRVASPRRKA